MSDIYAKPDLYSKVRYNKKLEGDGAEWEEREAAIYESADNMRDDHTGFQSQEGGAPTQTPPPVQRRSSRRAAVCLGVLCLLMGGAIVILSIHYILVQLDNEQLSITVQKQQIRYNNLSNSYNQSQNQVKMMKNQMEDMTRNNSRLQDEVKKISDENTDMTQNNSRLQDEVKKISDENTDMTRNNSQLQDEVKKQKTKIEGKLCPEGWKRFGSSCYFKSTQKKDWYGSRDDCVKRGAHLVIITSEEEQEFITNLNRNGDSWIGLRVVEEQGGYAWRWVDGSALTQGQNQHGGSKETKLVLSFRSHTDVTAAPSAVAQHERRPVSSLLGLKLRT